MLNPSNLMSVPKYLKRKEGGSRECLKTRKINNLDSRRASIGESTVSMGKVRASWVAWGRQPQPLVPWDIVLTTPGTVLQAVDLRWYPQVYICKLWFPASHNDASCHQELLSIAVR